MSEQLSDFQEICDAWGRWFSEKHGTSCRWVKLHAEGWGMDQYQNYKINVRHERTAYKLIEPPASVDIIAQQTFENDTDDKQGNTIVFSESTTDSFTWSLTEGIKVGATVGAKLAAKGSADGVEAGAEQSGSLSVEVNFSSTQQWSSSRTRGWNVSQPIVVPPHSKVTSTVTIAQRSYNVEFTSDIVIGGYIAIWNEDKINLGGGEHWLYFFPVSKVIMDKPQPGYEVRGNEVVFKAKGILKGVYGLNSVVKAKQSPLDMAGANLSDVLLPLEAGIETNNLINPVIGFIPDNIGSQPETK